MPILNFLIIEDDPLNRQVLSIILTNLGHYIIESADGPSALQCLETTPGINAVLLDIQMPGMDGLAVLRAIRTQPETRDIPVICISARARPDQRDEAHAAGADGYIVKPFRRQDLVTALDAVLTRNGVLAPGESVGSANP